MLTEKAVEGSGNGDEVGRLREVVVVAGIADFDALEVDAEAKGEAGEVESLGGTHLHHLTVVVAYCGKESLVDVELDAHTQVSEGLVGKGCEG